jgi:hypothetical protein
MNLLQETENFLFDYEFRPEDIVFIGTYDGSYSCTWEEFKLLADQNYNAGYGSQEVLPDLVIVFKDNSWISRSEYDGSEGWDLNRKPEEDINSKPLKVLFSVDYEWNQEK